MPGQQRQRLVGSVFGQIGPTIWEVRGDFGQKCPNSENFVRTKMGGFGKFGGQTFMGIIRGPVVGYGSRLINVMIISVVWMARIHQELAPGDIGVSFKL